MQSWTFKSFVEKWNYLELYIVWYSFMLNGFLEGNLLILSVLRLYDDDIIILLKSSRAQVTHSIPGGLLEKEWNGS